MRVHEDVRCGCEACEGVRVHEDVRCGCEACEGVRCVKCEGVRVGVMVV